MLYLHSILRGSRVNGPGIRTVVHLQGCSLHCAGCFNKETWPVGKGGFSLSVNELVNDLGRHTEAEGFTFSGGEPLDQWDELRDALEQIRSDLTPWSIILFTGYTEAELLGNKRWDILSRLVDVAICGRFDKNAMDPGDKLLRGSTNQTIHCFTALYTVEELVKSNLVEVHAKSSSLIISGFPTKAEISDLRKEAR